MMRRRIGASLVALALGAHFLPGCPNDECEIDPAVGFACEDEDADGFCAVCCDIESVPQSACAIRDCDDDDPYSHPFAADWFDDDKDFDCSDHDLGGTGAPCDSDEHCTVTCNVTTHLCSDTAELCDSGVDEDADGLRDCDDADCAEACVDLQAAACENAAAPGELADVVFNQHPSLVTSTCSSAGSRDAAFRLDAPGAPGLLELRTLAGSASLALRTSCLGPDDIACTTLTGLGLKVPVEGDVPLYLWLSEPTVGTDTSMSFEWSFTPAICGDGDILPPESCDDGNVSALDGCDDRCRVELGFDACSLAEDTPVGLTSGSTRLGTNLTEGSCGGANAPERLHRITPPADGTVSVAFYSDQPMVMYVRSLCDVATSEVACEIPAPSSAVLSHVPALAGVPIFVVVDGDAPLEDGTYDLTVVFSP